MSKSSQRRIRYPGGEAAQNAGDLCSQIAYRAATATFAFRKGRFGEPVSFSDGTSGPICIDNADGYLVKNSDGVGSKVLIAQRLGRHKSVAHDLIAMVADDAAAIGAEPFAATNSLDIAVADPKLVTELFTGLIDSCRIARIAMVGGEIAQLPEQVCGYSDAPYIWNADLVGIAAKEKLLDGTRIKPESTIIAVAGHGIRSNGLTLAQAILKERFGVDWIQQPFCSTTWGEKLLTPSLILTPFLVDLWSGYHSEPRAQIEGIVHITGGGIPGNLARLLRKTGLGAEIDNLFAPQPEFPALQKWGEISDKEAYTVWNMGQAHLIITDEPEAVLAFAHEQGVKAQTAGRISVGGVIRIRSKGIEKALLEYPL